MNKIVKCIVVTGNGTNCEVETAHACRLAGADVVDVVHISELLAGEKRLDDYDFLNLPGGFLDGDDLGASKAGANRIRHAVVAGGGEKIYDQLTRFIRDGKLILGICNGFQLLVKLGLLPGFDGRYGTQTATLTHNDSGRFEDRWVHLAVNPGSPCIFTQGLKNLYLPVRHGEGKFIPQDEGIRERLHREGSVTLRYCLPPAAAAKNANNGAGIPTMTYPDNPNGAVDAIAGICNATGRIFGLMPHPEAFLHRTNHPRWSREDLPEAGQGLALFQNAVNAIRQGHR